MNTQMIDSKINKAIHEALGNSCECSRCSDPECTYNKDWPNYRTDLNAMHEAEKVLDQMQARIYADHLAESEQDGTWAGCHIWHNTAAQRAEAFLRTLGKWDQSGERTEMAKEVQK